MGIPCLYVSVSTDHKCGIPIFISTFAFRVVAHKSDIPLWKLPREITPAISMYSMCFAEVKNRFVFHDGSSKTRCQRSDQRAVHGHR